MFNFGFGFDGIGQAVAMLAAFIRDIRWFNFGIADVSETVNGYLVRFQNGAHPSRYEYYSCSDGWVTYNC